MRTIFAYIFRETLMPLAACTGAFVFLWVIYDMFDNFGDFVQAGAAPAKIFEFYWQQVPRAIAIGLPIATLLAALYCLLTLSRNSEITAMMACGISPWQIGAPIIAIGGLATLLQTWLNWEWSPQAVRNREMIVEEFRSMREVAKEKREQRAWQRQTVQLKAVVYRSKDTRRLWFIYQSAMSKWQLNEVEIIQLSPEGVDLWKIYARSAAWDGRTWRFRDVMRVEYDPRGNAVSRKEVEFFSEPSLTETFEQVTSTVRAPDVLSVPELLTRIHENADLGEARLAPFRTYLFYRVTVGLSCLASVFMALPFAITASRRDLFSGFGKAILMYFSFFTALHFFVALGKGNQIPPHVAGAGPLAFFFVLGVTLFCFRVAGWDPRVWMARLKRRPATP
ncbi:MAG: LptF/LptG family permease [Verrucomicrobiae bacterium]|nr:LptF/LptG family permease [Verrucomicrobiae bacterium]